MLRVHAIYFGTAGRLYAADVDNSRIMVFDGTGKLLFEWGKEGRRLRRIPCTAWTSRRCERRYLRL